MKDRMTSDLKSHKYKKGIIQPLLNTIPTTKVSWKDDRLPEYLWLGLILMNFKRTEGIKKAGKILKKISKINKSITKPKLSIILSLPNKEQKEIYEIICDEINPKILAPLTVIYRDFNYSLFNKYFYFLDMSVKKRLNRVNRAIKLYHDHQSHKATDLRFVVSSMIVFQGGVRATKEASMIVESLMNYAHTSHDNEKMKTYRPFIRTIEMTDFKNEPNKDFIDFFWKEVGLKTDCKLVVISQDKEEEMDYKKYILDFQEKLNHLLNEQKDKSLVDIKFNVIVGTITYALKIFKDIVENKLDDSILGRHAFRTILETYINMKYLLKIEAEHPNIWEKYQIYGIGKYKRPLLKKREDAGHSDETHFNELLISVIINSTIGEEYLDIDLRYFDNKKVKEKFEEVGEKHLYEVLYEYDNNFIHGFWGAVRESSMLPCDNATHRFHLVPDVNFHQKLSSVNYDLYKVMDKFFTMIDEEFA